MNYILETKELTKKYGKKLALNGLSMHVPEKTIYGFLGVNGAGKTTTFGIIGGYIKATSGTFHTQGKVSILPQDARFYQGRKVADQLQFLAVLSGVPEKKAKKDVLRVLEAVGLHEKAQVNAEKLSHGMYKRLGIAQALLGDPDILLLDEPTSGLDPETAFETRKLIATLGKKHTVVISSHNLTEISDLCPYIGIIHEGKMHYEGPIASLTKKGQSVTFYLSALEKLEKLKTFPWILDQHFNPLDSSLEITFDNTQKSVEVANEEILKYLFDKKIQVREISLGKSLEESFLEMIKGEK